MHRRPEDPQDEAIDQILQTTRRIAVVGLSANPMRSSHGVALALQRDGYEIVPINPTVDEVLGEKSYATLAEVPGTLDLVNVFRREEHLAEVTKDALAIDAPAIWIQQGLVSDESRALAQEAGVTYVDDRCLKVEVSIREARPPAA